MGHTILGRLGLGRLLTVAGLAVAWVEQSPDQAVTDDVHDVRFRSCSTRNGAEERGLSAHVVFRRRKKRTRAVSTCSRFFFSSPCTPTVTAWS